MLATEGPDVVVDQGLVRGDRAAVIPSSALPVGDMSPEGQRLRVIGVQAFCGGVRQPAAVRAWLDED